MSSFNLNTDNVEFRNRQKKIFDQLKVLESSRENTISDDFSEGRNRFRSNKRIQKSETKHFRGKESIFKKPQNPAPKNYINRIPDFKKNPHKWTKYSLEDVQELTDESNKKSAMDFLKQLAQRKKLEQEILPDETVTDIPMKIIFSKYKRNRYEKGSKEGFNVSEENNSFGGLNNKASFSNSKLVMPEYVVGQKITKMNKKEKKNKPEKGKELTLDHLMSEDE